MMFLLHISSLDKKFKQFKQEVHQKVPAVSMTTTNTSVHMILVQEMEADNEEINIKRQLANVKHSYDELTRSFEAETSLRKKVCMYENLLLSKF